MNKLKKLIGLGTPGGLDDLFVRAVKTAVKVFLGLEGLNVAGWSVATGRAAVIVAAAAGASVVLDAILLWANKPDVAPAPPAAPAA